METQHDQAGHSQPLSHDDPPPPPPPPSQLSGNGHPHHIQLHSLAPPPSSMHAARTASSTPMTSPGLFSPIGVRPPRPTFPAHPASDSNTPILEAASPYLHPLQNRKVRETHKALIDSDSITGRKLINQYEVIEEIGRGVHGKVKLARNLETGENVAIKIIPRYSKKRRLGKVMAMSPQDKTMREIAILKKMRHPNVVSLLEIIDDPELRKIYLILEHVELGEVVWRKKGLPHICSYERRRIETEMRGGVLTPNTEEEQYNQLLERRQALKELKRARMSHLQAGMADYWSIEHGVADDGSNASRSRIPSLDDLALVDKAIEEGPSSFPSSLPSSMRASRATSRAPSRSQSVKSMVQLAGPAVEPSTSPSGSDMETPGALQPGKQGSSAALDGTMYGAYIEERTFRGRSPSMADSIISHMSSVDWNPHTHDPFAEDFSYVPCFTFEQARSVFRDTVLGLEYLHYQGVVHRDIKPANLLWTKDHRVKISDFGVSYFGRPVREGEPDDEPVSESEAQDFDDDLELAKTVGTPAFFAPELCYTDVELTDQPKISEMIDIWSLGVTLYCLIFARIPFQAEDEWVMFKKIATEDVYIPTKRLKPVDPATHPDGTSLYKRHNGPPYRDDNDHSYEEIGPELRDLLQLMFTKNPEKRIRLRDIKRHPWVTRGIANPIAWIDETDPARPSHGRRVQVDAKETAHAVVPITFLERARSVVKKAVGKVIHPLVSERSDSRSRRRATSSVASSGGDSSVHHTPAPTATKDRRKSIRADDYFSSIKDFAHGSEHPLSQSVGVSPTDTPYDPLATAIAQPSVPVTTQSRLESRDASAESLSGPQARASCGSSTLRALRRRSQHPGGDNFLALTETARQAQTTPSTPCTNIHPDCPDSDIRKSRDLSLQQDDISRSHSVDRALFVSNDKRAQPRVGLSNAIAPGTVQHSPQHSRQVRSIDWGKNKDESTALESAISLASHALAGYQHGQPQSDSNIYERNQDAVEVITRPQTAHRIEHPRDVPDARTPPPRIYNVSTPESFARAKKELQRRHVAEHQQQAAAHKDAETQGNARVEPAEVPCPPSPDDEQAPRVSREDTMETCKSSRSTSMAGLTTPLTSPSEVASPISSSNFPSKEDMLPFQSDPSLPALLSGASSSSADVETDLPAEPTSARAQLEVLETTDSLTPPAIGKETEAGFPLEQLEQQACIDEVIAVPQQDGQKAPPSVASSTPEIRSVDVDYEDSDSDEGLLMARNTRKKKPNPPAVSSVDGFSIGVKRRDTNASIASTETAKRFNTNGSDTASPSQQE